MQAGNLGFTISMNEILWVSVAFTQTTSDTRSLAFLFPGVLQTS